MIITRALDSSGRGGAYKTNRVSFAVLVELCATDGVRSEVARRARAWSMTRFDPEANARRALKAINRLESGVARLGSEVPNRVRRLKAFRDEFLAHNLSFEDERERAQIGDVTTLLDEITMLTKQALLAFSGHRMGYDNVDRTACEDADELWQTIREGNKPRRT